MILRAVRSLWVGRRRLAGLAIAIVVSVGFVMATLTLAALVHSTVEGSLDARLARVDVVARSRSGQEIGPGSALRPRVDNAVADLVRSSPDAATAAANRFRPPRIPIAEA